MMAIFAFVSLVFIAAFQNLFAVAALVVSIVLWYIHAFTFSTELVFFKDILILVIVIIWSAAILAAIAIML